MGTVTIRRDDWGVPHVSGETEADVFFGNGYAQAEDNLERILSNYLLVQGRLASVIGVGAVEMDRTALRWRTLEESRAGFERLSPRIQDCYRAFIAGIQRYIDGHPDEAPAWMPELEPALPIGLLRFMLFSYAYRDAVAKLSASGTALSALPTAEAQEPFVPRLSNEWVLMPWRTAADAVVLLSDPHGDIDGLRMFEIAMDGPTFTSVGAAVAGNPLPILGHTSKVAWGMTTGSPDVSDAYRVDCDPDDPRRYAIDGETHQMVATDVTIEVAGGDSVTDTFEYTRHNGVLCPVVQRDGNVAWVISTPYMHVPELQDEQLFHWHLAKDVHEFRAAMATNGNFAQNIMAGDVDGNVFYLRAGRTPIRPDGVECREVLDGNSSKTAWQGIHPIDDLVQILNPESGYMQNCNVAPDQMMLDTSGTSLDPEPYPAYIYGDTPGRHNTRGRRANDLLSRSVAATIEDALDIALDEHYLDVEHWQAALRDLYTAAPKRLTTSSPTVRRLVHLLLAFDGRAAAESAGATAYWYWRTAIGTLDGVDVSVLKALIDHVNTGGTPDADQAELLLRALDEAAAGLIQRAGRIDVPMGELFRIGRSGASYPGRTAAIMERRVVAEDIGGLASAPIVMPLRVMLYGNPDERGQRFPLVGGRSLRMVSFTDPITSYSVILYGQSGHADSPHHTDQCRLYSEGRVRSTYFTEAELAAHTVSTSILEYSPA